MKELRIKYWKVQVVVVVGYQLMLGWLVQYIILLEDNPTGIIIKKNEKAFKDALMKLYNNRELIVEYGRNGTKSNRS